MLRKKHSEINIKVPLKPYSPLRNRSTSRSPLCQHPSDRNLSPMKHHNHTPRAHPRQFVAPHATFNTPNNCQNTFEAQFESLASGLSSRFYSNRLPPNQNVGYRTEFTRDETSSSNFGLYSKGLPFEKNLKESKKLFTKCISVMNSAKKKNQGQNSVITATQTTKKTALDNTQYNNTSFKALKIQMIESVLPEDKNTSEKKLLGLQCKQLNLAPKKCAQERVRQIQVKDFKVEEVYQPIELINQSFSNAGGSQLAQRARLMESVCLSEASDYTEFDLLLQRVTIDEGRGRKAENSSVRDSLESVESQFHLELLP